MGPRLKVLLSSMLGLVILWLAWRLASSAATNFEDGDQAAAWRDSLLSLGQLSIASGVLWWAWRNRP